MGQIFQWKRFWCPKGQVPMLDEDGYLADPEAHLTDLFFPRDYKSNARAWGEIEELPCLVLSGELGIGKSTTVEMEVGQQAPISNQPRRSLHLRRDLSWIADWNQLKQDVFESTEFRAWSSGEKPLTLLLDEYDECLTRVSTLGEGIVSELRKHCQAGRPLAKRGLKLRIVCRSGHCRSSLEEDLQHLFGKENVGMFSLAPLRRCDVEQAAKESGHDPDAFLAAVAQVGCQPLASRPVTLGMLLKTYRSGGFPEHTRSGLYRVCLLGLCDEVVARRKERAQWKLQPALRLLVAGRLGAMSVFCDRPRVLMQTPSASAPGLLLLGDAYGQLESHNGQEFQVEPIHIEETLRTGLFLDAGGGAFGWVHPSYAEFLAAWYLCERQVTVDQICRLIVAPEANSQRVIPQLEDTAVWLAELRPEIFRRLCKDNTDILLRSHLAAGDETSRAQLVASLLESTGQSAARPIDWTQNELLARLGHQGLADQLRPYIAAKDRSPVQRETAIRLALFNEVKALQEELQILACDEGELLRLRTLAGAAVLKVGDDRTKAKLKPLAFVDQHEDPEDELKGVGLQAAWPGSMSAEELFSALTPPQNENLSGLYHDFLSRHLIRGLSDADIYVGLKWVEDQGLLCKLDSTLDGLVDAIVLKAWRLATGPAVMTAFIRVAEQRLRKRRPIFGREDEPRMIAELAKTPALRHDIISRLIDCSEDPGEIAFGLTCYQNGLVREDDFSWLLQKLEAEKRPNHRVGWTDLLRRCFDPASEEQRATIRRVASMSTDLTKLLEVPLLQVQRFESGANQRPQQDRPATAPHNEEPHPTPAPLPMADRVRECLSGFGSDPVKAWICVTHWLAIDPATKEEADDLALDLLAQPSWATLGGQLRPEIIKLARRFLEAEKPDLAGLCHPTTIYGQLVAGYQAFLLLWRADRAAIESAENEVWTQWTPVLMRYGQVITRRVSEEEEALVAEAYRRVPDVVLSTVSATIDAHANHDWQLSWLGILHACWDDRLTEIFLSKIEAPGRRASEVQRLLSFLSVQQGSRARKFAEGLVESGHTSTDAEQRERALAAATVLVCSGNDMGWPAIWPVVTANRGFGRMLLTRVASQVPAFAKALRALPEIHLGDLYAWLEREVPRPGDPKHEGTFSATEADPFVNLRFAILDAIAGKGSAGACHTLDKLQLEFPHQTWLQGYVAKAHEGHSRTAWSPPRPADLMRLVRDSEARQVETEAQLLDVVCESLRRYEDALHDELPAVYELWNIDKKHGRRSKSICWPREEEFLSNALARHLKSDLVARKVVVGREVQIRSGFGEARAQKTDIHVIAFKKNAAGQMSDLVRVIVEVKGCWNPKLFHQMEAQLVGDYLKNNSCRHGLYVVGHFGLASWNKPADGRRDRRGSKMEREDLQALLSTQASNLTGPACALRALVLDTSIGRHPRVSDQPPIGQSREHSG